jgi:hypothetical protein
MLSPAALAPITNRRGFARRDMNISSNCSLVDEAKARSMQLQMQLDQTPHSTPESDSYRRALSQIQALNNAVKGGDAQKAETALATASTAVMQVKTQNPVAAGSTGGLDVYA